MDSIRFISRISKVGKYRYGIYIPESVLKSNYATRLIEEWYRNSELLIIEIKRIHGMVRQ